MAHGAQFLDCSFRDAQFHHLRAQCLALLRVRLTARQGIGRLTKTWGRKPMIEEITSTTRYPS